MTAQNPNATYVSINRGEAVCPKEIQSRSICIDADIGEILPQLRKGEEVFMNEKYSRAFKAAFPYTIPIFAGFWFLGLT